MLFTTLKFTNGYIFMSIQRISFINLLVFRVSANSLQEMPSNGNRKIVLYLNLPLSIRVALLFSFVQALHEDLKVVIYLEAVKSANFFS